MTTGTLNEARIEIVEILQTADIGLESVPSKIQAGTNPFPFAMAHMGEGSYEVYAGQLKGLHDIEIEIHIGRRDLAINYEKIEKLVQDASYWLTKKMIDKKFSKLEHWERIDYVMGPSEWASTLTLAVFLTLREVKVYTAL